MKFPQKHDDLGEHGGSDFPVLVENEDVSLPVRSVYGTRIGKEVFGLDEVGSRILDYVEILWDCAEVLAESFHVVIGETSLCVQELVVVLINVLLN